MAVGKGGSLNNQNNSQSGNYSGTGSTTNTQTGESTSSVNAPGGWQDFWNSVQPGQGGYNPTQQGAVDWFQNALGNPDPAGLASARGGVGWAGDYFKDQAMNRTAPTLRNLAAIDPAAYGAPGAVGAKEVAARQGSEFMGTYQNPYTQDVVNTSLADYDVGTDRAANAFRLSNIAGGASASGSNPVGAAIFAGEANRGRGALGAGLRSNAFNTAAGLGMADANRFLQADVANQSAALGADQFNAGLTNQRQMFDAGMGMAYNDQRDRTVRDYANTQGQAAGLGTSAFGLGQGLASGLFGMGGVGQGQNLDWLNAAIPLFGQTNTSNQTSTGTSTESGTTAGTGSGSSRGKSGGMSIG